jgi:anti-sigma B factor antagonist
MLNIKQEKDGEKLTVALEGRLDTTSAPQLDKELSTLGDDVKELVFDIKYLDYVSSAGLRILLSMHKTMNARGRMVLRGANENVMEVFEVTGFANILNIEA